MGSSPHQTPERPALPPARLALIVPCYNEEAVLPDTVERLSGLLDDLQQRHKISSDSLLCLVDDGSIDGTWKLIEQSARDNPKIQGIKLAGNRGHQNALLAGLENAPGDVLISIDADLQDDVGVIEQMLERFYEGNDIVYGIRASRGSDTRFKRLCSENYYRLLKKMGLNILFNHADFRLMSRRAIEALKQHQEVNLFLRGLIPSIGFPSATVSYDRAERRAGHSKYPLGKMLALAVDGITSFSALPLRIIAGAGLLIFVFSLFISLWALGVWMFTDQAVPGWASSVLPMYLLGGIQLLSLGVIGEYVAKTYMETKRRPRYLIDQIRPSQSTSTADASGDQQVP